MQRRTRFLKQTLIVAAAAGVATTASAAWTTIDTFDGLTLGNIDGQNGWDSVAVGGNTGWSTLVSVDPVNPFNQVLEVGTTNGTSQGSVGKTGYNIASTPDANPSYDSFSGTLFFRARFDDEGNPRTAIGMSDVATVNASNFSDFETQVQFSTGSSSVPVVRDGSMSEALSPAMSADNWYNIWVAIDNTGAEGQSGNSDAYRVYVQSDDDITFSTITQVSTDTVLFRNFTDNTNPLVTLVIKGGSGNTGTVFFDDMYIDEAGLNLVNPIPEPSSLALAFAGGVAMLLRKRRA